MSTGNKQIQVHQSSTIANLSIQL